MQGKYALMELQIVDAPIIKIIIKMPPYFRTPFGNFGT